MEENENAALKATYSDLKIIKTRGAFQIILELPLENFNDAMAVLGGAPRPDREVWVAIARLNPFLDRREPPPVLSHSPSSALPAPQQPQPRAALPDAPKPKRSWFEMPPVQRASMRCDDHRFRSWLYSLNRIPEATEDATVAYVRRICGGSRSNLGKNGFEKETEAWDIVDHAYVKHLDKQLLDSMR